MATLPVLERSEPGDANWDAWMRFLGSAPDVRALYSDVKVLHHEVRCPEVRCHVSLDETRAYLAVVVPAIYSSRERVEIRFDEAHITVGTYDLTAQPDRKGLRTPAGVKNRLSKKLEDVTFRITKGRFCSWLDEGISYSPTGPTIFNLLYAQAHHTMLGVDALVRTCDAIFSGSFPIIPDHRRRTMQDTRGPTFHLSVYGGIQIIRDV